MDAKRTLGWAAILCVMLPVGGCMYDFYHRPAVQQEPQKPSEPPEPPQVVQADADQTPGERSDDVDRTVLTYIERVDEAVRLARRQDDRWSFNPGDLRTAADTEPAPSTQPVEPPPIQVIPESQEQPSTAPAESDPASQPTALEPPQLGSVAVRAAPDIRTAPSTRQPPGINTPAVARAAPATLKDFLDQYPAVGEGTFREQIELRMLWAIAGEYQRAREPLSLVTAEQQELAAGFIDAWIAIHEAHMGDLASAATVAAEELADLQESLRKLSDLSLPVLEICSAVRGFGQYDAIDPPRFLAGVASEFVLYCEVRDFVSERRSDDFYYTTFDMTTTLLNRAGDTIWQEKDPDIVDRCRNRRHDCFIPRLVRLPTSLSPGRYVAKVTIVDKLGAKVAENSVPFEVVVRP